MKCCRRIVSILLTAFLLFAVLAPLNAALVNADDALPVITIHEDFTCTGDSSLYTYCGVYSLKADEAHLVFAAGTNAYIVNKTGKTLLVVTPYNKISQYFEVDAPSVLSIGKPDFHQGDDGDSSGAIVVFNAVGAYISGGTYGRRLTGLQYTYGFPNPVQHGVFLNDQPNVGYSLTLINAVVTGTSSSHAQVIMPGADEIGISAVLPAGATFLGWEATPDSIQLANSATASFTMPESEVTIQADIRLPEPVSVSSSAPATSGWSPSYQIRFLDCGGRVISEQWVAEGQPAAVPSGYEYAEEELYWVYRNRTVSPVSCRVSGYEVPDTADRS